MRSIPLLPLVVASILWAGCEPSGDDGDTDTGADPDDTGSDTGNAEDTDDTCSGTLTLTFGDMPTLTEQPGETWTQQGITFRAEDYNGNGTRLIRDTDDCMELQPGAVQGRIYESGCAGTEARFVVQSRCGQGGRGCTDVIVGSPTDGALSQASALTDKEATLTLTERDGFSIVALGSLDARLCRIEVDLIPLTEALAPEDTGAPF